MLISSAILVWGIHSLLSAIEFRPQWWLSAPSMLGCYSGIRWLFDLYGWRLRWLRTVKLISVPDLNGQWIGNVESSYDDGCQPRPVSATIQQRWSKMVISFEAEHSKSHSITANLRVNDMTTPELTYQYLSEPMSNAPSTMEIHRGTATLLVTESGLEGDYYSGRGRREHGTISLRRSRTRAQIANYN